MKIYPEGVPIDEKGFHCAFWLDLLVVAATETASLFMSPIYLVGSALTSDDPLDIDIVMVVDHKQYWAITGTTEEGFSKLYQERIFYGPYERMMRHVQKQKKYWEGFTGGQRVDFKIQTEKAFAIKSKGQLYVRIDQLQDMF